MRRFMFSIAAAALVAGFVAPPSAFAQRITSGPSETQSINFLIGGFSPRGQDSRGTDDVLFANGDFLTFDFKDFNGVTVGGEWLVALGNMFDAGLGVGFYQRTSPAVYTKFVNSTGAEIEQDLKLRIVPITATVRFLPLGHHSAVVPYIGAGVGIFSWRYSESGQFLDADKNIFRDTFIGKGTNAGPVVLGGVLLPIGSAGIGGEIRYQSAKGTLPASQFFSAPKIDLGGFNYLFTVNFRF